MKHLLSAGLLLAAAVSSAQAATATIEGHFTSRSVLACDASGCNSSSSDVDVTMQYVAQIDFGAPGVLNVDVIPFPAGTVYHGVESFGSGVPIRSTGYDPTLLAPAFGPLPISQSEFEDAQFHTVEQLKLQFLGRDVAVDNTGATQTSKSGWQVEEWRTWTAFFQTGGASRSWSQSLTFNFSRYQSVSVAAVSRNWTADEFFGFITSPQQPFLDDFTVELAESSFEFGADPKPTIYYRGSARIVSVEGIPAVPEPGTWLLMLAGGAALLAWRRRA